MSKKIVIIGTTAEGILGFRREVIKSLVAEGHQVYAFAIDYTRSQKNSVAQLGAIPCDYYLNRTGMNPLSDIKATLCLASKLKKINPYVVFSYFSKPVIFGTLAARLAGVKHIIGMLEGLGYSFTIQSEGFSIKTMMLQRIQVLLYKFSFSFLERIIFLNSDDSKDLVVKNKIKVNDVKVLGGIGLDLKSYPYSDPGNACISFLFIGRLLKEKGINEFIGAALIVKKKYPHITFTVLGGLDEGNPGALQYDDLDKLVNSGVIDYPGQVTDVAERIDQSSVFVLPSYREGVPRSTQEAMAIGRPVITTDVPGCRETVVNGLNGFLIRPWDIQALANKMLYFIEYPSQIKVMGLESHRIAQEKFNAEKVNKKLISLMGL